MIRNRLTWVIVAAVVVLLVVAGVDALLSSDGKTTASPTTGSATSTTETSASPTTALTTTAEGAVLTPRPPCTQSQIEVSIEVLKFGPDGPPVAALVMRGVETSTCWQEKVGFLLTVRDRRGRQVGRWQVPPSRGFGGLFERGVEGAYAVHDVDHCDYPGPYVALVTVGPYSARRGNLSRSEIACGKGASRR